MAEELLVKCRKCGLVYDKLRNRGCPKCEPRVRPGSVPPAEQSAAEVSRAGGAAGDGAAAGTGAKAKRSPPRPAIPKTALALLTGVVIGFGGARYLGTRTVREPLLLPMPAPAPSAGAAAPAPAAGGAAPATEPSAGAPSTAPSAIDPSVVAGTDGKTPPHPIELLDARRGVPRPDGTVEYTAVLINRTANTVKELRVRGLGEDKKGNQVVTAEVAVEPAMIGGGREATARIVVPDGTTVHEYAVTAWFEHGAMVRVEAPAPPPDGERRGKLRPFPPSTLPDPADVDPVPQPGTESADDGAG